MDYNSSFFFPSVSFY